MGTYFLKHCLHKVQHYRLTGGLLEGEVVIYLFYVWYKGVGKVRDISGEELALSS